METYKRFKIYKNKLNMLIRKSKRKYFFMKLEKSRNNMKETWREINTIIGKGNIDNHHNPSFGVKMVML